MEGYGKEAGTYFASAIPIDAKTEVRLAIEHGAKVRDIPEAKKFRPKLPMPVKRTTTRRISFIRDIAEIKTVSLHLFREDDQPASVVGERCFEKTLLEAKNAVAKIPYSCGQTNSLIDKSSSISSRRSFLQSIMENMRTYLWEESTSSIRKPCTAVWGFIIYFRST